MTIHTELMVSIIMLKLRHKQRRINGSLNRDGAVSIWYFIGESVTVEVSIFLNIYIETMNVSHKRVGLTTPQPIP